MLRYSFVLVLLAGLAGQAQASWADDLFEQHVRDFGSVPHGPMLSYPFRFKNNLNMPVHISNVRVSCGCVAAQATQDEVGPGQTGVILVQMNTLRFIGHKTVTVYVQFDRPQFEEVQLMVKANSRTEVMLTPDSLSFGQMRHGSSPSASLKISFLNDPTCQIVEVKAESNYILTSVREVRRDALEVVYELTARIRNDVPVGKWYSDIWLTSTSAFAPKVRVPLTVEVLTSINVSPKIAVLDPVDLGATAERKVLIRGTKPFRILGVKGIDAELNVIGDNRDSKPIHVLTVRYQPRRGGEPTWIIHVQTDSPDAGEVVFQVKGQARP